MNGTPTLRTSRLVLRSWTDADVEPLRVITNHPDVVRWFPGEMTVEQAAALVDRHRAELAAGRPGLFAVEVAGSDELIGFVGLSVPQHDLPFQPCVEIGWRLARHVWGHGYATEAARTVLGHGFATLGLDEVVSFTAATNERSRQVMRRLGMHRNPREDFEHPALPPGHELRAHVLYRLGAREWQWSQEAERVRRERSQTSSSGTSASASRSAST